MESKRCSSCNRDKELHLYYKDKRRKDGYHSKCKACDRKQNTGATKRAYHLMYNFGITPEEYQAMLDEQGGRCYVCRAKPYKVRLAVDHDHAVEAELGVKRSIRGLLCKRCNRYLAVIKDDPAAAQRIIDYLTKERPFSD